MDKVRRGLLGGAVIAGALGARQAAAQGVSVSAPLQLAQPQPPKLDPSDLDAEAVKAALRRASNKSLKLEPVGEDWANLHRYRQANTAVKAWPADKRRAVFMGDSISDAWPGQSAGFFDTHGYVGRGISGQTTAQMVVRFWPEVVDLKPRAVHILAGTNDVAENRDPYDPEQTARNLSAMGAMARAAGIRVVMGSVPPATSFAWKPDRGNQVQLIKALNIWIQKHCQANGYVYADYWPVLAAPDGSLKTGLGSDSVHPNAAGYAVMAPVAKAAISKALKQV